MEQLASKTEMHNDLHKMSVSTLDNCRNYNSTEIQQVCQGVDIAITFLGIGITAEVCM